MDCSSVSFTLWFDFALDQSFCIHCVFRGGQIFNEKKRQLQMGEYPSKFSHSAPRMDLIYGNDLVSRFYAEWERFFGLRNKRLESIRDAINL